MKLGVVKKSPTVNRFVLHTLHLNITHLAVLTRKTNTKTPYFKKRGKKEMGRKIYHFQLCMSSGGMAQNKSQILVVLYFYYFELYCYYCSIDLKKQSEPPGLSIDTSSLPVPTFVKKVTKYMCVGWVFFQTNFDFYTSHF